MQKIFGSAEGPSGLIIYVGNRQEYVVKFICYTLLHHLSFVIRWKAAANVFRAEPWNISSIPTIIKLGGVRVILLVIGDLQLRRVAILVKGGRPPRR